MKFINLSSFNEAFSRFKGVRPFDHCVIDNFFLPGIAEKLEQEFLDYNNPKWFYYKNAIEDKKALNDWNQFPIFTYQIFRDLMSEKFVEILRKGMGCSIYPDQGLHGGGWHIHGPGGNLNPHLDYSIHPKVGLLRKINIIIYVSSGMRPEYGGHLGLWEQSTMENGPGRLVSEIEPKFNRAVMFDTTQNSWHGMSRGLIQPEGIYRKSLAIYYLTDSLEGGDNRERALFAPREEQKADLAVKELIKIRADSNNYYQAYNRDK